MAKYPGRTIHPLHIYIVKIMVILCAYMTYYNGPMWIAMIQYLYYIIVVCIYNFLMYNMNKLP